MRSLFVVAAAAVVGACGGESSSQGERPLVPFFVNVSPRDGQEAVEQPILSDEEVTAIFLDGEQKSQKTTMFTGEEDSDGIAELLPEDLDICSQLTGMPADRIVLGGAETRLSLDRETVLALRVVDSRTRISLSLSGTEHAGLSGLCLFMGGNQPMIDVRVGIPLELMVIHTAGREARANVIRTQGGSILDWAVRLSGENPRVTGVPQFSR